MVTNYITIINITTRLIQLISRAPRSSDPYIQSGIITIRPGESYTTEANNVDQAQLEVYQKSGSIKTFSSTTTLVPPSPPPAPPLPPDPPPLDQGLLLYDAFYPSITGLQWQLETNKPSQFTVPSESGLLPCWKSFAETPVNGVWPTDDWIAYEANSILNGSPKTSPYGTPGNVAYHLGVPPMPSNTLVVVCIEIDQPLSSADYDEARALTWITKTLEVCQKLYDQTGYQIGIWNLPIGMYNDTRQWAWDWVIRMNNVIIPEVIDATGDGMIKVLCPNWYPTNPDIGKQLNGSSPAPAVAGMRGKWDEFNRFNLHDYGMKMCPFTWYKTWYGLPENYWNDPTTRPWKLTVNPSYYRTVLEQAGTYSDGLVLYGDSPYSEGVWNPYAEWYQTFLTWREDLNS